MIKKLGILIIGMLLIASSAVAQILPSAGSISPGLTKWIQSTDNIRADATLAIDDLFYIKDLSVLKAILSSLSLTGKISNKDQLQAQFQLYSGGEQLSSIGYQGNGDGLILSLNEKTYELSDNLLTEVLRFINTGIQIDELRELFVGETFLGRVSMEMLLDKLKGNDLFVDIPGGFTGKTMSVNETFSDDGLRLTRLDFEGSFLDKDGQIWSISGFVRKPGGTSPKDSGEILVQKDENNYLNISLSGRYEDKITQKEKSGTFRGTVRISVNGKRNGNSLYAVLNMKLKNEWKADGVKLSERITLTPEFEWKDQTPGLEYMHLNQGSITGKHVLNVTSYEEIDAIESVILSGTASLSMDKNTAASGSYSLRMVSDPEPFTVLLPDEPGKSYTIQMFKPIFDTFIQENSRIIYEHLGEKTKEKLSKGL